MDPDIVREPLEAGAIEHDQYPMLRDMVADAEYVEVPGVIVRELFAERDALMVQRDRWRAAFDRIALDPAEYPPRPRPHRRLQGQL